MPFAPPSKDMMFEGDAVEKRAKFAELSETLDRCLENGLRAKMSGDVDFARGEGIVKTAGGVNRDATEAIQATLAKSLTGDQLDAVTSALASADIAKTNGWTLSNPLSVVPFGSEGLVPYNLSPILQMIVPREMPLRNSTPRTKGVGTALNFRSITGVSNSASGGAANLSTFFTSANTTQTVGGINWNRPPAISYDATSFTLGYQESGVSDYVTMQAEYAGQGYTSLRSLSALSTLWASMLGDERNMLGGQAAATVITGATATAATDATVTASGLPGATATAVYVTFTSSMVAAGFSGESQAITCTGTPTTTAGQGIKLTALTNVPANTLAINIYVNYSGTYYKSTTPFTIAGAYGAGASPLTFSTVSALPSTSADNGSYAAQGGVAVGYDGFLSVLTNASLTGYHSSVNAALSTTSPTVEFQTAFQSLYTSIAARPETIYTTPSIRVAIAKSLQASGGSATGFRVNYEGGTDGIAVGNFVTGVVNEATGDMVNLEVHRYMPAGTAMIVSNHVPWADSGITNCWEVNGVVDTVILEWPQTDLNYAMSSYSYNVLAYKAPALSGVLTNINN